MSSQQNLSSGPSHQGAYSLVQAWGVVPILCSGTHHTGLAQGGRPPGGSRWADQAHLPAHPQDQLRFPRMLMKLVSLRTLSSVHSEQVFALRLQDKKLPPLLSEIWDVHE